MTGNASYQHQGNIVPSRFVLPPPPPPLRPYASYDITDVPTDSVPSSPLPPYAPPSIQYKHQPYKTPEATTIVPLSPPKLTNITNLPPPPTVQVVQKKFWGHFGAGLLICLFSGVLGFFALFFLKYPRAKRFYALGGGIGFLFHVVSLVTIGVLMNSRTFYYSY